MTCGFTKRRVAFHHWRNPPPEDSGWGWVEFGVASVVLMESEFCVFANNLSCIKITSEMVIAYAPCYVLDVPDGHRFPMRKYELLRDQLLHEGMATSADFIQPVSMPMEVVQLAHDPTYCHRTLQGLWSKKEERRSGFPWSPAMVAREQTIMQGTLDCALHALKTGGVALNIAGGTHHAYGDHAEGFCIFNDFAIASKFVLSRHLASRVLIVDCDVHQGNGTASILQSEPRAVTFSMHGASNYPLKKEQSSIDVPLEDGTSDEVYLDALEQNLNKLIPDQGSRPDLVFYQCGVDILDSDKLGRLSVSMNGCRQRDRLVFERCANFGIPVVCAMGGGYTADTNVVVQAHVNTFREALDAWT